VGDTVGAPQDVGGDQPLRRSQRTLLGSYTCVPNPCGDWLYRGVHRYGGRLRCHRPAGTGEPRFNGQPKKRTEAFALLGIIGTAGVALGALAAGIPNLLQGVFDVEEIRSYQVLFFATPL
jgi:hypothetical protein